MSVLEVNNLKKTFRIGFMRKRVDAVRGVGFEVVPGEIFGLLGPNGAGKTTTIKMVLQLIFPSAGTIRLFGRTDSFRASMQRVGYLPENPYVYQYLRPLEFLDLCGRLVGMKSTARAKRAMELVERVGLSHAVDRPIGRFSKGMMQRIGLAQALLHDPEFLILDEPMSGLDPIGRKEVRSLILEQRKAGKTLLFTSHILSDVEMLCDRVAIMNRGLITTQGKIRELLRSDAKRVDLELEQVNDGLRAELTQRGLSLHSADSRTVTATIEGDGQLQEILRLCLQHQAQVLSVSPHRETLENLFVRDAVQGM